MPKKKKDSAFIWEKSLSLIVGRKCQKERGGGREPVGKDPFLSCVSQKGREGRIRGPTRSLRPVGKEKKGPSTLMRRWDSATSSYSAAQQGEGEESHG